MATLHTELSIEVALLTEASPVWLASTSPINPMLRLHIGGLPRECDLDDCGTPGNGLHQLMLTNPLQALVHLETFGAIQIQIDS